MWRHDGATCCEKFSFALTVSVTFVWEMPTSPTLEGFVEAWRLISPNFRNSVIITIPAALNSAFIAAIPTVLVYLALGRLFMRGLLDAKSASLSLFSKALM